jgi:hypothetical protein
VVDFSTHHFQILPPKGNFATEPIVAHLLRAGRARFLRDGDVDILWDDQAPACLEAEKSCVLV